MQQYQKEEVWQGEAIPTSEYTRAFDGLQQPVQNTGYQQAYTQQGQQPPYIPNNMQSPQGYYAPAPQFMPFYTTHESNIDGRTLAVLSYIGLWLSALLVLLFVPKNRFARFHAMQALLFYGGVNILYIVLITIMHHGSFLSGFAIFFFVIMNIVASVAWFVGLIGAGSGKYTKLPFVGNFAERFANHGQAKVK